MLSILEIALQVLRVTSMILFNVIPRLLDVRVQQVIYSCWILVLIILVLFNHFSHSLQGTS